MIKSVNKQLGRVFISWLPNVNTDNSIEVIEGVFLDFDCDGNPISIQFMNDDSLVEKLEEYDNDNEVQVNEKEVEKA